MKLTKIDKVQTSLKQLIDVDPSGEINEIYRVDDIRHNQVLIAKVYQERQDVFKFEYLSNFFAAGTGITLTTNDAGVTTITSTATSSGVSTNSNVLIDCGAFLTPNENVLVDCGTF
jgi:hypothetical protein